MVGSTVPRTRGGNSLRVYLRADIANTHISPFCMIVGDTFIGGRVEILGRDILGLYELSPHDLHHTWATRAAKNSDPFTLRDAGGWTNMQTPGRYVERAKVVNEGIELDIRRSFH